MKPALFLDRDGVINQRIVGGYVRSPDQFVLIDDILPVLSKAHRAGWLLVLISNQQGVGKGLMSQEDLDAVHRHMQDLLRERLGFGLDAMYTCTSLAAAMDPRRKPQPGMLLEAIRDLSIDPATSWFVGDSLTDAQAGRAAGIGTILIGDHPVDAADFVAPNARSVVVPGT